MTTPLRKWLLPQVNVSRVLEAAQEMCKSPSWCGNLDLNHDFNHVIPGLGQALQGWRMSLTYGIWHSRVGRERIGPHSEHTPKLLGHVGKIYMPWESGV